MLRFLNKGLLKNHPYYSCVVFNSFSSSNNADEESIYHILNPFIDFDSQLQNDDLKDSLSKRNIKIDFKSLSDVWLGYKGLQNDLLKLEHSKVEIQQKIKSLSKSDEKQIQSLKLAGKLVREDLKNITNVLSSMEKNLIPKIIKLPNVLRDDLFEEKIETFCNPKRCTSHHLEIGKNLDLIDYLNPTSYFLKGEAAHFELNFPFMVSEALVEHDFIPFSNPDFSRNVIVEGTSDDPDSLLKLSRENKNYDLFLNGSASFHSFCSYHAKSISQSIPIKYVCHGRQYKAYEFDDGLFSVWQGNAVQIFVASSSLEIETEFKQVVEIVKKIYLNMGLHFRIVRIPPNELSLSEALRLSFQVYSPYKDKFYEAGNLSFYSDYVSKRLRMYYKSNDDKSFLHVVSGTIVKIPPLLASLLEHNENKDPPLAKINKIL